MNQAQLPLLAAENAPVLPAGTVYRPDLVDLEGQKALLAAVAAIATAAPFAHARMRNGAVYSAAMTNAGTTGWWSDEKGYRYTAASPLTGKPWPPLPDLFRRTVQAAVAGTPWAGFVPDACLINFYEPGAKMGLHQDKDEKDFTQPIVTVSLGDAADFLIGGLKRGDKAAALRVNSGDALIMGGESRLRFHGVRKIHPGTSPLPDAVGRTSLTFRRAL